MLELETKMIYIDDGEDAVFSGVFRCSNCSYKLASPICKEGWCPSCGLKIERFEYENGDEIK